MLTHQKTFLTAERVTKSHFAIYEPIMLLCNNFPQTPLLQDCRSKKTPKQSEFLSHRANDEKVLGIRGALL